MRLQDVVGELGRGLPELEVRGLSVDSRSVKAGDLFVARPGVQVDGARFAAEACARGAVAVVAEQALELPVPCLVVPCARQAAGELAARFYGNAGDRSVKVIGVTGTNGKTSTVTLIHALLERAGWKPSLVGTVETVIGGERRASTMTTPDVLALHESLARTRAAGGRALVMEVSSHALEQRRVAGLEFDCGVFTNLTQDHLDYHGSMAAYQDAKARLFEDLGPDATAVLNAADPTSDVFARRCAAKLMRYGFGPDCEPRAEVARSALDGTELRLHVGAASAFIEAPLVGRHNVENLLAAAGACLALGLSLSELAGSLARAPAVPGRLERVSTAQQPAVFVDYAHTPDALERVLRTLRPLTRGRLSVVFGCGGDRDRGKRPLMGAAAARYADALVVTSDNPRSEDPARIVADILPGLGGRPHVVELDRAAAIERAIRAAGPRDVVLIAGKGHEQSQTFADRSLAFCDRQTARQALASHHPAAAVA